MKAEHKTHKKTYLLLEMNNSSIITSQVLKPYYWFKPGNSRELYIDFLFWRYKTKLNQTFTSVTVLILLVETIEFDLPRSLNIFLFF